MAQNMKLKLLTLITKLSDRDTYTTAASELESLARGLESASAVATFLTCILSAGPNDKLPARKQCLYLISILSLLYPSNLASYLPKILAFITRRLRDPDSSIIRPQCASTAASLAKNLSKVSFFNSFVKPLSEALFTEQELNSLLGIAMCLSAAVEATADPEPLKLGKFLLPKLDRVLKSEGYKGKQGGLTVLGSVIFVGGAEGYSGLSELVGCLMGFLKSDDWATRKASAEALKRLAVVEKTAMAEHKSGCMKMFESRRFDKVKATREVMNQMIEAWKQLPDVSEETSPPPRSIISSGDEPSDGRILFGSRASSAPPGSENFRKRINFNGKTATSTSKLAKNEPLKRRNLSISGKVEGANSKVTALGRVANGGLEDRRSSKSGRPKVALSKISDDKPLTTNSLKSGSSKSASQEMIFVPPAAAENVNENQDVNHTEGEDLSSIRNQLVQIQRQQSHLFDLLQSFMGSSQNGIRTIESRVHGLEAAMDDLALSSERRTEPRRMSCCLFPSANSFTSKLRGITRNRSLLDSQRHGTSQRTYSDSFNVESRRLRLQAALGVIVNPLAEIPVESRGISTMPQS